MEFIRQEELSVFQNKINKNPRGKFIIYGAAGMGKTTFLHMLEDVLERQGKKVIWISSFFPKTIQSSRYDDSKTIFFLDGLDERRNYAHLLTEIVNRHVCCVCTSREMKWNSRRIFNFEMELGAISDDEAYRLICGRLGSYKVDNSKIESIVFSAKREGLSPMNVMLAISSYLKDMGLPSDFFLNSPGSMYQSYVFGKGLDLTCPQIILPEHNVIKVPSEIRNDIKVLNNTLLDQIARKPEILDQLTYRQFEEIVCDLFEKKGYNVKLTKQTRDGGKDVIIVNHSLLGELVFYAECKKYARTRPVGVGLVRELYGTVSADRVTAGILITSSYFTDDAWRFRGKVKAQMNLLDYSDLIREIQNGVNCPNKQSTEKLEF